MPTGVSYGRQTNPSSFRHLRRMGPSESELARYLYPMANRDVVYFFDDFVGGGNQEPAATDWNEAVLIGAGTNGTDFVPATTQLVNGAIHGITENVAGDEQTLRTALVWAGDNRCGMEIRWSIDNITNVQWEIGFTDALSAVTTSGINAIDTPTSTNGWDDGALIGQDTGATLKTLAFITDGSTSGMNTTKTNLGTRAMVNSVYKTMRVQLDNEASFAYIFDTNGALQERAAHGDALVSQIKGSILLQWWAYFEPLATSARNIYIDYIGIWQDRFT